MSLAADTRNMYVEKEKQVLKHTDAMTEARQLVKTFFSRFCGVCTVCHCFKI